MEHNYKEKTVEIWVDADACPGLIKDILLKASLKRKVHTCFVANQPLRLQKSHYVSFILVNEGPDVADQYIVDHATKGNLAVTADIPLASQLVDKGVITINPRGRLYTPSNVKEDLATRNIMNELREGLALGGGPKGFNQKDVQSFANTFDKHLTQLIGARK